MTFKVCRVSIKCTYGKVHLKEKLIPWLSKLLFGKVLREFGISGISFAYLLGMNIR